MEKAYHKMPLRIVLQKIGLKIESLGMVPLKFVSLRIAMILSIMPYALGVEAQTELNTDAAGDYNLIKLEVDTLPGLNIARSGHHALCLNGQMTVFGGHTDGFIPTPTAEYFKEGRWHTVPLTYPHDHGVAVPLRSGKVFLSGGHKEPLGIGQLFSAEIYDPKTNTSKGFGCMNQKRAFHNALEMADGQIYISGNWHESDAIEVFEDIYMALDCNPKNPLIMNPATNAVEVKDVSYGRALPYILRISDDDAIIFSSLSQTHQNVDCSVVDRLKGETYNEPFLSTWTPLQTISAQRSYNQFIGDLSQGRYEWLIPVFNVQTYQVEIAHVKGVTENNSKPTFSLFPLAQPIPSVVNGKHVDYNSLICDKERGTAYLLGTDTDANIFVIAFPYNSTEPAPLTIYMTGPQPISTMTHTPMLTPEGDLVFAGGTLDNNFSPSNAVFVLPVGSGKNDSMADTQQTSSSSIHNKTAWVWILAAVVFASALAIMVILYYRKRNNKNTVTVPKQEKPIYLKGSNASSTTSTTLNQDQSQNNSNIQNANTDSSTGQDIDTSHTKPIPELTEENNQETAMDKSQLKEDMLLELYKRILQLMEQEQIFLNPNLRALDVAQQVGSNTSYVSAAINSQCGSSFSQFLTSYRVAYAQRLMLENPENKLSSISTLSGFTTDSTFFRAFRSVTGMSPKEWLFTKTGFQNDETNAEV